MQNHSNGHGISFGDDENILKLIKVIVSQLGERTKKTLIKSHTLNG